MKGGIGETDIDLSNLLADAIKLESGVGKIALILPAEERRLRSQALMAGSAKRMWSFPPAAAARWTSMAAPAK